jgi:hypothetical protein
MANKPQRPMPQQPQRPMQTPQQQQIPDWVLQQQRQQRMPINPRNYLRPNMRVAKVFDLNKMMATWGKNQAKYKEGDVFISKKILQNLEKSEDFAQVISQDKFKKNLKTISDIASGGKGEISYKFKEGEGFLAQDLIDQNYIHHYKDNVWKYYLEKNKNETEENTK